jgi:2-polyprenyl-6-methoxyphenol hydroxylase-like FAD-dependent oxidoreductase
VKQPKIAIVGGSLVGPAAELFLRHHGLTNVTTYEANPRPHSQSGGVMGVRYNTLDLLAAIGIERDTVIALTDSDTYAFDVQPNGEPRPRSTSSFPGMVTSWDALHHQLARRVDVQHGHTIRDVHDDAGRQTLVCSCGNTHDADTVLWADGRKSTGRTLTDPDRPLTYNGYVVWRGLAESPTPTPKGFQRYYDIPGGRLFSITEPVIQSGKSYWEFSHNLPADEWRRIAGDAPEKHAFMLPKQVTPAVRDVIRQHAQGLPPRFEEMAEHSEVSGIPVNDVPVPAHAMARRGRGWQVLLGDALVPVRLQVGAGLNQGLHQAADFAEAVTSSTPSMAVACWDYAALSNLSRVVEMGRSRAHRNNLGWYLPVRPGKTTAPADDQWADPQWVTA